jgi:hypothetical protein
VKRTPLRRTELKRPGPATATVKALKPKTCAKAKGGCGEKFTPARDMQSACGWECGKRMGELANAKKAAKAAAEDKRETRAKLEAMKKYGELVAEVQTAFNLFIRRRDKDKPCICCGQPLGDPKFGGAFDAGHYLSRGSAPNLRFDETNVNAQRKGCNRPGGTTRAQFRAGMVGRHGLAAVEALEADQAPRKHTKDELRAMRAEYRAKAKQLMETCV